MGFAPRSYFVFCMMILILPAVLCSSNKDAYVSSRATYYSTPDGLGTPTGACGYGEYGRTVYNGNVGGVSKLYRNGLGCGACYEVRCKIPQLCKATGVKVVATDYGEGDNTDFILSKHAFEAMAKPGSASKLFAYGVVAVDYKRVPCDYPNHNLAVKVHEQGRFPDYLAILFVYQAGKNDITAVQLWQAEYRQWKDTRKVYGAVWDMPNPPSGALSLRVQLNGGQNWVYLDKAIPKKWKTGHIYETGVKLA
ncbi:expansin-like B1 [Diospyros lotus]|uniref:expansin-like B1 n=1 Tax=Diospyros lotus TaxID=55363 RepID=UPI002250AA40|nr:expansin-like B1 [Diospyros lotus]